MVDKAEQGREGPWRTYARMPTLGSQKDYIGAGASAFDNAAMAPEAGACAVDVLCRRAAIQLLQPYRC